MSKAKGDSPLSSVEEIEPLELDEDDDYDLDEPASPAATALDIEKLVTAITASQPARKMPLGKFKTRSPFNPTGKKRKLSRVVFLNGNRLGVKLLTDNEIERLNKIQNGTYADWASVKVVDRGPGAPQEVHISYPNKSHDDKLRYTQYASSFEDLLGKFLATQ